MIGLISDVKVKFTYKEFSMIIGVLVALVIMLTLWLNGDDKMSAGDLTPTLSLPTIDYSFVKKVLLKIV